jgi:adenylate cyclase
MSKPSSLITKKKVFHAAGALLAAVLILTLLFLAGVFSFADRALYDLYLLLRIRHNSRPLDPRIFRIDLNDSSEASLGGELDTRQAFADLLFVLGQCGAQTALDFIFKRPAQADGEIALAARKTDALIQAVIPVGGEYAHYSEDSLSAEEKEILRASLWHIKEHPGGNIPLARTFIMSNPEISSAATRLGHIGVQADEDGNYRRSPLFYRWEDGLLPALSLATVAEIEGIDLEAAEFFPGKELVLPRAGEEPIRIPVDSAGYTIIPFTVSWADDECRVSFDKVVRARYDESVFEELFARLPGSLTIVVDITTAKQDYGVVPFEAVYPRSEIHVAIMNGMLSGVWYCDMPGTLKVVLVLIFAALSFFVGLLASDLKHLAGFFFLFAASAVLSIFLWMWMNMLPWHTMLAAGIFLTWAIGFGFRLFSRYREQLLLRTALGRYFPRSLAERIAAEGKIELVPAYKELTILFADIAGFTKWSSDKTPDVVHSFLSDYLESLARILFAYGGTVDKFMGDGLLAFFGDPFDMPDHAARCLAAALAMQGKIAQLAEKWRPRIGINLKVRIGVNTGKVIVGNLGTKTRIEYTVIGSAVNLAQRMESNAPVGGILVTAAARSAAGGGFSFGEKLLVSVKGYEEPIEAYELNAP